MEERKRGGGAAFGEAAAGARLSKRQNDTVLGSALLTLKLTNTRPKPVAAHSSFEFPGLRSIATTVMPRRSAPYWELVRSPGSPFVLCPGPVYAGSPSGCQSPHLGSSPEVVNSGQVWR